VENLSSKFSSLLFGQEARHPYRINIFVRNCNGELTQLNQLFKSTPWTNFRKRSQTIELKSKVLW